MSSRGFDLHLYTLAFLNQNKHKALLLVASPVYWYKHGLSKDSVCACSERRAIKVGMQTLDTNQPENRRSAERLRTGPAGGEEGEREIDWSDSDLVR